MDKTILLDLANETSKLSGSLPGDFAVKMAKRIRRKFAVKIEPQQLEASALHFREIYLFGRSVFKEYLKPQPEAAALAQPGDLDFKNFVARTREQFPAETEDILENICGWVLYYEYLR